MAFTIDPSAVYSCDNGAMLCGDHVGRSAAATGRDLSGQPIERLTQHDMDETRTVLSLTLGVQFDGPLCETCAALARRAARALVTA